jgi:hypothetical protein
MRRLERRLLSAAPSTSANGGTRTLAFDLMRGVLVGGSAYILYEQLQRWRSVGASSPKTLVELTKGYYSEPPVSAPALGAGLGVPALAAWRCPSSCPLTPSLVSGSPSSPTAQDVLLEAHHDSSSHELGHVTLAGHVGVDGEAPFGSHGRIGSIFSEVAKTLGASVPVGVVGSGAAFCGLPGHFRLRLITHLSCSFRKIIP